MGSLAPKESRSGEVKPFASLRKEMVKRNIAARGVRDELVLDAMRKVPRELFLPKNLREFAYEDSPLPIAGEQTISQPYIVAFMAEALIAIPTLDLAQKVVDVGNCSGRDVAKFQKFGLTPLPAERVKAPLIAECIVNLECKVADSPLVNKYNLFVLEVMKAWTDPRQRNPKTIHHHGYGKFVVDGEMIKAEVENAVIPFPTES
jgi:hypothetical protein